MQTVAHEGSNSIWINPLRRCFIIAGGSFVSCGLLPSRLAQRRSLSVIFGYCLGTSPYPLSFVRPGDFCHEIGSCKPHLKIQPQTPTAKTPPPNRLPPIHPRPRRTGTLGAPTSSSAHGSPRPRRTGTLGAPTSSSAHGSAPARGGQVPWERRRPRRHTVHPSLAEDRYPGSADVLVGTQFSPCALRNLDGPG
jgi:hypothetical protein